MAHVVVLDGLFRREDIIGQRDKGKVARYALEGMQLGVGLLPLPGLERLPDTLSRIPIAGNELGEQPAVQLFVSHKTLDAGFPVNAGNRPASLFFPV